MSYISYSCCGTILWCSVQCTVLLFKPNVICSRMMLWAFRHNEQIHNHQTARGWHLWLGPPRAQSGVWRASCYKKVSMQELGTVLLKKQSFKLCGFSYRMKRKFYSWEECMNLREVKVRFSEYCVYLIQLKHFLC